MAPIDDLNEILTCEFGEPPTCREETERAGIDLDDEPAPAGWADVADLIRYGHPIPDIDMVRDNARAWK